MRIFLNIDGISPEDIAAGDRVLFGRYFHNDEWVADQRIKWRVLDVTGGTVLMISEYILDAQKYDSRREILQKYESHRNIWPECRLREWLNGYFLNTAFNEAEKRLLAEENGDRVTILDREEFDKYFSREKKPDTRFLEYPDRVAFLTPYAEGRGIYPVLENCGSWWWIRFEHPPSYFIGIIDGYGVHYTAVVGSLRETGGVRPVIRVSLKP